MNIKGEYAKITESTFKKIKQKKIKGLKIVDGLIITSNQIIVTYTDSTLTKGDFQNNEFTINNEIYILKFTNTGIYKVVKK